jgi:hypothetical protein
VCFNLVVFAAPLSSIVEVMRERDSSAIYPPWTAMALVSALCWAAYGSVAGLPQVRQVGRAAICCGDRPMTM